MEMLIRGCRVFLDGVFVPMDVRVADGRIAQLLPPTEPVDGIPVFEYHNCLLLPGLTDVHVHLRDPGFSFKETMRTGTQAAARGGYTTVCPMPNLNPVPDSAEHLNAELQRIRDDAVIRVLPYAAITVGEKGETLADLEGMAKDAFAFSDDGKGVQSDEMMKSAMLRAKALGKVIVAHCEDETLLHGGYIHDGAYARAHGHRGICSASEWKQVERDVHLAEETGCAYHVCHVSTKESVQIIREAKARGVNVTCETAPHYLLLTEDDLQEDGRFKMNPPIREKADRDALRQGLLDGTVDMIATDHAPHTAEEKSRGLEKSLMGVVGLECSLPVLYTGLVKPGIVPMETLIDRMTASPAKRFGLESGVEVGKPADLCVFDPNEEWTIDPREFASMGKATPFVGWKVSGRVKLTICDGEIVFNEE
ncbi:MAG: dihydroorotase [Oscillospiraceae bacterium]|nr:dihydroorotase [Oscillospiraceae bacterium]